MSIHQKALEPDEILDNLHSRWMANVKEIGERLTGLRDAMTAGWQPDKQSETNLANLCKNFEQNAFDNMDNVRTVLLCAEYNALRFLPDWRARANEICLALSEIARPKPSAEEMAKFAEDVRAMRIPMPGGSEQAAPQVQEVRKDFGGNVVPFRSKFRRK